MGESPCQISFERSRSGPVAILERDRGAVTLEPTTVCVGGLQG
ncbi:MAG: hypothetical protein ACI8X5_000077 [Planctomycetota bacterium]|jgi:hypothetical protein